MMTYYCVSGRTTPWTPEMEQTVGCYSNKLTAQKVAAVLRDINMSELPGGIDVTIQKYQGEVIECPAGLRLKETPMGRITMIIKDLNREEYQHLVDFKFQFKEGETVIL